MIRGKILVCWIALLCCAAGASAMDGDMARVKLNMCESYVRKLNAVPVLQERVSEIGKSAGNPDIMIRELQEGVNPEAVEKYFTALGADSSWSDLNYQDASRSGWHPSVHTERLMLLAKAYKDTSGKYFENPELGKAIHRAMGYWFAGDFRCRNWWYNQIGVPKMLGTVFLLMEPEMSADEKAKAVKYMENAKLGMTGQNSVWLAENVLVRALLLDDEKLFTEARSAILKELKVNGEGEGIRPDWSFHQHGPQLQFGNYGLAFANTMAYWARMFRGTRFALTDGQLAVLRNYLMEGMQWIVWKRNMDISSCGRQLFRYSQEGKALSYGKAVRNMEAADPQHEREYKELYDRHILVNGEPNEVTGFRYYPYSDFAVSRRTDGYMTLKMSSSRVIGSEVVNSENLSGYYLGDGALYVYGRGDEYRDIYPVWDWTKVPGVTCYDDPQIIAKNKGYARNGGNFVGGISGGSTGVAAMRLDKSGVTGQKSYFFTGDAVVCLGSGIRGSQPARVTTAVAQSLKQGGVTEYRENGKEGRAFCHDGVAYVFPEGGEVQMTDGIQAGNWRKVAEFYDTVRVEKEVFRLWIDHGKAPENAGYCYGVIPGVTAKEALRFPVKVLRRDEQVHAVEKDGCLQAVFFGAGTVDLPGKAKLSAGQGCLVMAQPEKKGYKFSVCDPTWQQETVVFRLSGKWEGGMCRYDNGKRETEIVVPVAGKCGGKVEFSVRKA